MKFGHVAFEVGERTYRHTDRLIAILGTPTGGTKQ